MVTLKFFVCLQLVLRENDLISLPKEIGNLTRLRELHVQGNRLTVLPPELGEFWKNYILRNLNSEAQQTRTIKNYYEQGHAKDIIIIRTSS